MAIQDHRAGFWAIVLASGEGARLSTLTHALCGWDIEKQFADPWGGRANGSGISALANCGMRTLAVPWLRGNLSGEQWHDVAASGYAETRGRSQPVQKSNGSVNRGGDQPRHGQCKTVVADIQNKAGHDEQSSSQ